MIKFEYPPLLLVCQSDAAAMSLTSGVKDWYSRARKKVKTSCIDL